MTETQKQQIRDMQNDDNSRLEQLESNIRYLFIGICIGVVGLIGILWVIRYVD